MSRDNNDNSNNRNKRNGNSQGNGRRSRNQNSKQEKPKERKDDNKQVLIKYESKSKKDLPTVELKYTINTRVCEESMVVFEDGLSEECLKLIKEFKHKIETYNLWSGVPAEAAAIVYSNFRRCMKGHA
jgi:hypothetical protein